MPHVGPFGSMLLVCLGAGGESSQSPPKLFFIKKKLYILHIKSQLANKSSLVKNDFDLQTSDLKFETP